MKCLIKNYLIQNVKNLTISKAICDPRPKATLESNRIDNLCSFSAVIIRVHFNSLANFVIACFLKNNKN